MKVICCIIFLKVTIIASFVHGAARRCTPLLFAAGCGSGESRNKPVIGEMREEDAEHFTTGLD
jgi:hypothetical protein